MVCAVISLFAENLMTLIFYLCVIGIAMVFIMLGRIAVRGMLLELSNATEEEYEKFIEEVAGKQE